MKAFLCFILKPYMFSVFSLFQNFFLFWFSRNRGLFSRKPATGSLPYTDSNMYFSFLFKFSFWNFFAQLIQFITLLTHYYSQFYFHHLQGSFVWIYFYLLLIHALYVNQNKIIFSIEFFFSILCQNHLLKFFCFSILLWM